MECPLERNICRYSYLLPVTLCWSRKGQVFNLGAVRWGGKGIANWNKSQRSGGVWSPVGYCRFEPLPLMHRLQVPLLFVVEKSITIFTFFWVSTLAASLVANFVSLLIFGLTPITGYARQHSLSWTLDQYWIYLIWEFFLQVFLVFLWKLCSMLVELWSGLVKNPFG